MTSPLRCERCAGELSADALFCPMCGTPRLRPDGDALLGSVIADRYLLQQRLGHGASGNIYVAEHVTLRRKVAVKILHHELSRDDLAIERFRREATTVGEIDNEHIVEVYDFGRMADGRLFLAMEFLEGTTLKDAIEQHGRLPVPMVVDTLIQLGEALMEAHAMGYIHRDLRPRNVFLARRRGQDGYVKLLDFGLSKLVEREGEAASTSLGMTFGDPHYMSPEQAQGEPVGPRSDIYSLGCITYQALVGQPPFVGEKVFDVLTKHVEDTPPPPSRFRPDVPAWLDAVLARMLSKKPDERFVTVYRMIEALREGSRTGAIMPAETARKLPTVAPPPPAPRSRETAVVRVLQASETGAQAGGPPPAAPPIGTPPSQSGSGPAAPPGMSGMWFADGEAIEEEARRAEAGKAAKPRGKNGSARPAWSQEFEYDDGAHRRKIVVAGSVIAVALVVVLAAVFWPSGDGAKPGAGASPDATAVATALAADAAAAGPDAGAIVAVAVDAGVVRPDARPRQVADSGGGGGGGGNGRDNIRDRLPDPTEVSNADAAQADFYVKLGRQALGKGDAVGAAANFNKAREFDPKNGDAIAGLGEVAMQQGYYDDAIVHLEAATRLAPRSARLWALLGQAYQGAGQAKQAAAAFKKALKLDPGNEAARRGFEETSGQ